APTIPRPLEAIILTCLHKEKERRYSSAEALARDVERFLNGEKVRARMPRSPARLVFALSAAIAFGAGMFALWRPAPLPDPIPSRPPAPATAKIADRSQLDRGLLLLGEARLDLYRAGTHLGKKLDSLREAERCFT